MENKIKGGLADGKTIEDIARKHSVFAGTIQKALERGIKVESEHTTDKKVAKEIAMDHLWEDYDYYEKLEKMEKGKCDTKKENKEQTMSDSSGAFEGPLSFKETVLKKDIHKLHNFNAKKKEVKEQGIGSSGQFDGPIGTAGPSSPMDHTKKKRKDPLALDEKGGNETASITAASTKDMISTKKGFPRFGGPEAKFVQIDKKCKTFPYCNQGDSGEKFKFINEIKGMKEAIEFAAKKHGLSFEQVAEIVLKESEEISEALPVGIDFSPALKWGKADEPQFIYHLVTIDPKTKEPAPLDIKVKSESDFAKLKLILHSNGVKFMENKHPLKDEDIKTQNNPVSDEDDDTDFDDGDDIFANMKK